MRPKERLLTQIIDVQCLFEIIDEDYKYYYDSEVDVDMKALEKRIEAGKKKKLEYLTLLN